MIMSIMITTRFKFARATRWDKIKFNIRFGLNLYCRIFNNRLIELKVLTISFQK